MRRALIFVVFCALAAGHPASAGPLEWAKHHKRFLLMESAAVGGALLHAHGLHQCRRNNGVEPCDAHYGEAWASYGIVTGLNVIVMPSTAEACWKDGGGKWCYPLAFVGSAAQAGWGVHEWRIHAKDNTPDHPAAALRF